MPLVVFGDVGEGMGQDGVDVSSEQVESRGRGEVELEREIVDSALRPGSSVMAIKSDVNVDNWNGRFMTLFILLTKRSDELGYVDLTFWGILLMRIGRKLPSATTERH